MYFDHDSRRIYTIINFLWVVRKFGATFPVVIVGGEALDHHLPLRVGVGDTAY